VIITLYVDDLILPSIDLILLKGTKDNLLKKIEMVDLGDVQYCLGIQINCVQQNWTIYLNQNKYIGGILRQFGMAKNKLVRIPFMINYKFLKDMNPQNDANLEAMCVIMFQNVMHKTWYCTTMGVVNQFMINPEQSHWIIVNYIFHYFKGIMDFGMCFHNLEI
jgi:hypothetical protein